MLWQTKNATDEDDWMRPPPTLSPTAHRVQCRSRHTGHSVGPVWPVYDLVYNDTLIWLLPTHRTTLLVKFCVVPPLATFFFVWLATTTTTTLVPMRKSGVHSEEWLFGPVTSNIGYLMVVVVVGCGWWWCYYYRRVWWELCWQRVPYMDPTVPAMHRLPMHVTTRLYATEAAARRAACHPELVARNHNHNNDQNSATTATTSNEIASTTTTAKADTTTTTTTTTTIYTDNVWRLDDLQWMFCYKETAEEGLAVVQKKTLDNHTWKEIQVPGNWTLQGYDKPIYTNIKYPWPCQPPLVPHMNPTGVYRLQFELPATWRDDSSDFSVIFHGVESAYYVYCNDQFVGFSKDSRLPAEFNVTPTLRRNETNTLHVVVLRWSDGSYVEDQDQWWMAGTIQLESERERD